MIRISSRSESVIQTADSLEYSIDGIQFFDFTEVPFTNDILVRGSGALTLLGAPCRIWGDQAITIHVQTDVWNSICVDADNAYVGFFINGEESEYHEFAPGTQVEVRIVPQDGYEFSHWSDSTELEPHTENPRFFILNENVEVSVICNSI